ncbi:hypothetical protein K402DRAFT_403597 [Aulographum hederae CBS 113979]|uniref:Uncharacterized protein n=1 Tax=Aulographum hederae CBS 113979 TaxID=1176131 RepID=A0A6G1H351_9PEZI|nr:hypothetical protein K402DRAFT_403597 [Aulographum hederae CBS 113979]
MPRPARAKVASAQPARVAPKSKAPGVKATRAAAKRNKAASEDIQEVVVTRRTRTGKDKAMRMRSDEDVTMAGALPEDDPQPAKQARSRAKTTMKKVESTGATSNAMEALRKRRGAAKGNKSPSMNRVLAEKTAEAAEEAAESVEEQAPIAVSDPARAPAVTRTRRSASTASARPVVRLQSRAQTPQPAAPRTISDDDDLYGLSPAGERSQLLFLQQNAAKKADSNTAAVKPRPPQSTVKAHGTPSILALANFKRRARQPSILAISRVNSVNGDYDDMDDFDPDDESTPLNLRTDTRLSLSGNSETLGSGTMYSSGSRKRKLRQSTVQVRSSPDVQVPQSSPPAPSPTTVDDEAVLSQESDLPEHIIETQPEPYDSDTMAPPRSSSPSKPSNAPSTTDQEQPTRPVRKTQGSATKSKTTTSPLQPRKGKTVKSSRLPTLSTAALQSLLPQRRRKTRAAAPDTFDIPSSSDADELGQDITVDEQSDDEVEVAPPRRGRRGTGTTSPRTPAATKSRKGRQTLKSSNKNAQPPPSTSRTRKAKAQAPVA